MTKKKLLDELATRTWVALKPSPLHGIGVFAIQDIPKGCQSLFSSDEGEWIKLSLEEVENLPAHSRSLVETYCLYDEYHYYVPADGFKKMDLVFYLNHSADPNIISINDGACFETLRDIAAGEELLINYNGLVKVEGYE